MFIFLSTSARARVIAADLRAGADGFSLFDSRGCFADNVAFFGSAGFWQFGRPAAESWRLRLMRSLLRHVAKEIFKSHQTRRAAEDVVANFGFDVDHQFFEYLEGFGFVFDERITLAVRAQVNAVPQTVHLIEMFLPEFVDGAKNGVTLDFF